MGDPAHSYAPLMAANHFNSLGLTDEHALAAGLLASPRKDPFDRLIGAQLNRHLNLCISAGLDGHCHATILTIAAVIRGLEEMVFGMNSFDTMAAEIIVADANA